jgi:hypothetical protein
MCAMRYLMCGAKLLVLIGLWPLLAESPLLGSGLGAPLGIGLVLIGLLLRFRSSWRYAYSSLRSRVF